jgi:hypothetical protein
MAIQLDQALKMAHEAKPAKEKEEEKKKS